MRILIANPNTSERMTELMVHEGQRASRPDTEVAGVPAAFGVPYIATRSETVIAGYALLETLARHHADYDAVIVGAFCHAFVPAAKELLPIPVVGLVEAGLRAAQLLGRRISIVGIGAPGRGMNDELLAELDVRTDVASIRILDLSGTALAGDQQRADAEVVRLCEAAVAEDHADVVVLGGAAFSGMGERISREVSVPIVSPVTFAVSFAETFVRAGWRKPRAGTYSPPDVKTTTGIGPELAAFFAGDRR